MGSTIGPPFIIQKESENILRSILPNNWLIREQKPDFYIDYSIEIVENGELTGKICYVQLKGKSNLKISHKEIVYQLSSKHLIYFRDNLQIPVFLIVTDINQNEGYWVFLQKYINDNYYKEIKMVNLKEFAKKEGINSPELDLALSKGNHFYVKNLFTNDSYVKYFSNSSKYPIEAQSYAQAIKTLSILGNWDLLKKDSLLNDVISKAIKYLYNEKGFFYFKKTKYFTFKTPYFRWSLTPMILALEHANQYMNMK